MENPIPLKRSANKKSRLATNGSKQVILHRSNVQKDHMHFSKIDHIHFYKTLFQFSRRLKI